MPQTSQALYFHLNIQADDDGVVEAFPIMRLIGANEDDLKVLVAKNYIRVLNEDLVSFVLDWREHNNIRADRKIDSIYKELLLSVVPETDILQAKPRSDVKDNTKRLNGQSKDGLGKVRLGKYNNKKKFYNINKELDVIKQHNIREEDKLYLEEREKNNSEVNRQIKELTESKKI